MEERGANNMSVGNSVYQFEMTDPAQAIEFARNTLVGCGIQPAASASIASDLF
jgi:hypothetical protein